MDRVIVSHALPNGSIYAYPGESLSEICVGTETQRGRIERVLVFQTEHVDGLTDGVLLGIVLARLRARQDESPAAQKARANLEHAITHVAAMDKVKIQLCPAD